MRASLAILVAAATLAGMTFLLTRDGTGLGHLAAVGGCGGLAAGALLRGRAGVVIGGAVGLLAGLVAPLVYAPFWLAFTLPPHPDVDL